MFKQICLNLKQYQQFHFNSSHIMIPIKYDIITLPCHFGPYFTAGHFGLYFIASINLTHGIYVNKVLTFIKSVLYSYIRQFFIIAFSYVVLY